MEIAIVALFLIHLGIRQVVIECHRHANPVPAYRTGLTFTANGSHWILDTKIIASIEILIKFKRYIQSLLHIPQPRRKSLFPSSQSKTLCCLRKIVCSG